MDQHADDAQHDQGRHLLTVKKPAGMHCTQQTTAQLDIERRRGAQRYGRIITETYKVGGK